MLTFITSAKEIMCSLAEVMNVTLACWPSPAINPYIHVKPVAFIIIWVPVWNVSCILYVTMVRVCVGHFKVILIQCEKTSNLVFYLWRLGYLFRLYSHKPCFTLIYPKIFWGENAQGCQSGINLVLNQDTLD